MMNIRTRSTALIVAIGTALALAFSFVPTPAHGATTVHKLNYEGEVTCPDSNPIKGMTFDARSGHVSTQCYTQFYWDANMMGGEVFMEFDAVIRAGYTPGTAMIERVTAAVADWKAERIAIDALRDDAQRRAQAAADASPGDVICKAWSYTSRYNGSGGGSVCAVNNNPVDVSRKPAAAPAPAPSESVAPAPVVSLPVAETVTTDAVATRYFAKTNKIPNLSGFATKLTFPKAPKGTKIKIAKSAGDSCKVSGRVVNVKASGTCDLTVTLSRKGKVVGSQTLLIGRS
ncbi:MAG: hypothetical protein NT097_03735 [Actinobacteria bacterium]|nr:hypothetical protein [Actinomycetota bacterium]